MRGCLDFVEGSVGVQVKYIGTGPKREDMIVRLDKRVVKADWKALFADGTALIPYFIH